MAETLFVFPGKAIEKSSGPRLFLLNNDFDEQSPRDALLRGTLDVFCCGAFLFVDLR
jgi:hypothetical protein